MQRVPQNTLRRWWMDECEYGKWIEL